MIAVAKPGRGIIKRARGSLAAGVLKTGINREFRLNDRAQEAKKERIRLFHELDAHRVSQILYANSAKDLRRWNRKAEKLESKRGSETRREIRLGDKAIRTRKRTKALARRLVGSTKK